jgi:serine/threonine protein kinase
MSPEIVSKKEYCGKQCDVWALGILLFNMIYGRCPFRGENERDLYRKIGKGIFTFPDEMPSNISEFRGLKVSDALKSLVKRILVVAPEKRITCSEIL